MLEILILVVELVSLYFLSKVLMKELGSFLYRVFSSRKIVIWVMALLFLPGTFLHEMSHLVMAVILGVRVGEFNILPEISNEEKVKMGSVAIAKSDPIRRALIGAAPFFIGVGVMLGLLAWLNVRGLDLWWEYAIAGYAIFEIGNTTFSSSKDMEGTIELLIALGIVVGVIGLALYLLGVRFDFSTIQLHYSLINKSIWLMTVPLLLETVVIVFMKLVNGKIRG